MSFVSELQRELVLISLARSGEEGLRLVRHESGEVPRDPPVGRSGWDVLSLPSISIPTSTYEIFFASVPAYCVTLEQHPVQDAQEVSEGTQFRRYKSSRFLEFRDPEFREGRVDAAAFYTFQAFEPLILA